jgi:hypothetical protein
MPPNLRQPWLGQLRELARNFSMRMSVHGYARFAIRLGAVVLNRQPVEIKVWSFAAQLRETKERISTADM